MAIFNSYVKLPEGTLIYGNPNIYRCQQVSTQHLFSNLCFAGPVRRLGARHGAERRSSKAFVRLSTLGFSRFPKLVSSQSPKTQVISLFAYHGLVDNPQVSNTIKYPGYV